MAPGTAGRAPTGRSKFSSCATSDRYDADIRSSTESGNAVGIDATPTFFINGRRMTGALPADQFAEAIEEELNRPKS